MENVKTFNKKFSSPVSMVYTAEMLLFSFFFYFLSSLFFARKSRNGTTYRIGQLTDPVPEGRRSIWIPFVVCVCFSLFCFFVFSFFFFLRRFFSRTNARKWPAAKSCHLLLISGTQPISTLLTIARLERGRRG